MQHCMTAPCRVARSDLHSRVRSGQAAAGARRQIAEATGVPMQAKPAVILNAGSWAFEHPQPLPPKFQVCIWRGFVDHESPRVSALLHCACGCVF